MTVLGPVERATIDQVQRVVSKQLHARQAGHGMDHVLRVLRSARTIRAEVGGDAFVVDLAALLHDVGDAKFHDGKERSAELSREILSALDVDPSVIEHVAQIVDKISFRRGVPSSELTLEGKIVQDADRLDALGAIGIVRTIEYGASLGQPFFVAGGEAEKQKTGIDHFHDKLFKLRNLLNTAPARRIAAKRERFMRMFLDQFFDECGTPESE